MLQHVLHHLAPISHSLLNACRVGCAFKGLGSWQQPTRWQLSILSGQTAAGDGADSISGISCLENPTPGWLPGACTAGGPTWRGGEGVWQHIQDVHAGAVDATHRQLSQLLQSRAQLCWWCV